MGKIFADTIRMKHGRFILPRNRESGEVVADVAEMQAAEEAGVLVEEMVATTDTKEFFTVGINDFFLQDDPQADEQWRQLFTEIPSTKSGELFPFRDPSKAGEGSHGIRFEEVGEGGEIKFSTVTSKEKFIKAVKYATALGYSNEWFEDGDLGLIEMTTEDFRRAANDKLATIHYGVITTAIALGVAKSAPVGGTTLDDFIAAINSAVSIMRRNRFEPDWIVGAPEQEDIILQALHDVYRDRTLTESSRRLQPLITDFFPAGTVALVQSRRRLVSVRRLDLMLGSFQDLLHDAETLVGKFRRGAALGDGRAVRGITGL